MSVYIGYIDIPDAVEAKIRRKHAVTGSEVREALQWPAAARSAWEHHPEHGTRLLASGDTATGRTILAVLQAVDPDDGYWRLRTARAG